MFNKLLFTALSFSGLLFFSSCSKTDTISRSEDIQGNWAITDIHSDQAYDWDGDGQYETDIYGTYSACDRDIYLTFNSNGNGQIREGCDAPYVNLYWQLSNNRLDITIPSGDLNLDIIQFDSRTIRGNDQVNVNGRTYTITYTLSRR